MSVLVIDKSVLVSAPKELLKELRGDHCFLLTDTLLYEIATEKVKQRCGMSVEQETALNDRILRIYRRAVEEAGNSWVDREPTISWEIERGISAADSAAPRNSLSPEELSAFLANPDDLWKKCIEYEEPIERLASTDHAPSDEAALNSIRRLQGPEFLRKLRENFGSMEARVRIANEAKETLAKEGRKRGYVVSACFEPGPNWLSFGMILAKRVFLPWKLWRYGDGPADRSKPANPWFDTDYVAYVAIADGLLSGDSKQLELAWACWPEKESSILAFDTRNHTISPFRGVGP